MSYVKSHCRVGGVTENWMGDSSCLGLGEIEGEINVTKNQRGLNQAFVLARGMRQGGGERFQLCKRQT